MLPAEFREQLQMALHIYLRPAEGAAVADHFDVDKVGSVNGESFVRWFLQAGLDSREVLKVCRVFRSSLEFALATFMGHAVVEKCFERSPLILHPQVPRAERNR